MKRRSSVVATVLQVHLISVIAFAAATVAVGSATALWVVVRRDDAHATALARTLDAEIRSHEADPRPEKDALIAPELAEERWFGRRIEVWRGASRIGGPAEHGVLGHWVGHEGCRQEQVADEWTRTCVVQTDEATTIVVASPLAVILADIAALIGAIAATALVTTILLTLLGRAWLRRRLSSLAEFERRVGTLRALEGEQRIEGDWGVAEVDTLAATLNALLGRIQRAVEREQRFVADAAHELRSPLTRLNAQLELASEELSSRPSGPELRDGGSPQVRVAAAMRTSQELGRTIEILLALARNQATIEEAVDLDEVVMECVGTLPPEHTSRVQVIRCDGAIVRGDELLLRLAVGNLLDNALKYSTGPIDVRTICDGDAAVHVEDHGPGMTEADLARVREPFVRGSQGARQIRGAGLGLALVDHVAALHGGTLELRSTGAGLLAALRFSPWRGEAALGAG